MNKCTIHTCLVVAPQQHKTKKKFDEDGAQIAKEYPFPDKKFNKRGQQKVEQGGAENKRIKADRDSFKVKGFLPMQLKQYQLLVV